MLLFFLSLLSYLLYLLLKYRKSFYMLQQNSYNVSNRYTKWMLKNYNKTFVSEDLLGVFVYLIYFCIPINFFYILIFCFYLFLFYLELKKIKKEQQKKKFVITSRIKRLFFTLILIILLFTCYVIINFNLTNVIYYYIGYALLAYLSYIVVFIVNILNKPVELMVYFYYKNKALNKLKRMNNLIKIGITGSYGKTTSKNMLNEILNAKYNSFATPKSFNTPYGLMNAINNNLDKFDDVFIAEMGACKKGDITELCNFVKPKYGIITKIGMAHLETFKKIENTIKEKFRLIEMLPSDGVGILNIDDKYQREYVISNNCKIVGIGIDNDCDVRATNIKMSNAGMTFDIIFDNKDKYSFKTTLLGRANIYNILSSVALGKFLGISIEELQKTVRKLKPSEHRLEIKKYSDNITIIDDAFNSNPEGSKMALEVLNLMSGYKVVVTPGMIELGDKQYELNKKFGEYISDVADFTILVGEKQTKPILEGLLDKHYPEDKICVINDVKTSFKIISEIKKENIYVLLENDLPDIFNEK